MVFCSAADCDIASVVIVICIRLTLSQDQSFPRDELFVKPFEKFEMDNATNKTRFTTTEKRLIMEIHNSYRSLVYPYATDMRELIWDDDLEEYAYNHTQACTGAHSNKTMIKKTKPDDPMTWITWKYMAENLYYSYAPSYSIRQALWLFWAEGEKYDIITDNCTHKQTCGHYLALVLARSSRIGCAMNICKNFSMSSYPTPAVFIACDYDGMLLASTKPYTVGNECSDCTRAKLGYDFQFCRHRLCVSPAMHFTNSGFSGNTSVVGLSELTPTEAPPATTTTTMRPNITTEQTTTAESSPATTAETTIMEQTTTTETSTTLEPSVTTVQTATTNPTTTIISTKGTSTKATSTTKSVSVATRLHTFAPNIIAVLLEFCFCKAVTFILD